MKSVEIYTDGACSGNPGKGGWGAVLIYNGVRKEISAGYECTTNNRMELIAAIEGLSALKESCKVDLYSDSKYLVDAIEKKWVFKWESNNWMRDKNKPALNSDLWKILMELLKVHEVKFIWVKGHAANAENNRCDELARKALQGDNLLEDTNYGKGF